jgi:thioredoxin-like negative regulator of GroEL
MTPRARSSSPASEERDEADAKPILFFCTARASGPARRMQSLVAWLEVTRKSWLRVVAVDVERYPVVASRLGVEEVPTFVLVAEGRQVGRIDGATTSGAIAALVDRVRPGESA